MAEDLTFSPGDMIVFEDTGEVCVLIEKFDAARRRMYDNTTEAERARSPEETLGFKRWCWATHWVRDWEDAGEWQVKLSVPPKHQRYHGVSAMNLFNYLSHRRARRDEAGIIRVPKRKVLDKE
tara:strand:+ start:1550 stop:1918 length:369 start_codon:yes stop_codon:yes gene_type:complete